MSRIPLTFFLSILSILIGCGPTIHGSGEIVTEQREIPDLKRLSVCCGFDVELSEGDEPSLELTGDDNIVDAIEVRQEGSRIRVDFEEMNTSYRPTQTPRVEVVLTDVQGFTGSGGVGLEAGEIETEELEVELSGGSSARFDLVTAETLDLLASGGGSVRIEGTVDRQTIQLSGGSSYRASNLNSKVADLRLSGGSKATISVSDSLTVNASGGSSVRYEGDPDVDANTSGGSTVGRAK